MDRSFITRETAICSYVCDKYYIVDYNYYDTTLTVKGFLVTYYGGNVVLLSEEGIYHIKYKDIIFMKPMKMLPPLDKFNTEYQKVLETLQIYNTKEAGGITI